MYRTCLLKRLDQLANLIGNTPLLSFPLGNHLMLAKMEAFNPWRSSKDRPAFNILRHAIEDGLLREGGTVVESSSGNFAISLAGMCRHLGLRFVAVVDPNINAMNAQLLHLMAHEVIQVRQRDETGGFLLTRLQAVHAYCASHPEAFWPNQYANIHNPEAYHNGLGDELVPHLGQVDDVFIAVSTGGALKGISTRIALEFPRIRLHAVDVEGSMIFGSKPRSRKFSGLGSSIRPLHVEGAHVDEVAIVSEDEIVEGCSQLLQRHALLCGASSGAVYAAACRWASLHEDAPLRMLCIFPDSGITYLDSVFKDSTCQKALIVNA